MHLNKRSTAGIFVITFAALLFANAVIAQNGNDPPFTRNYSSDFSLNFTCNATTTLFSCPCEGKNITVGWTIASFGNRTFFNSTTNETTQLNPYIKVKPYVSITEWQNQSKLINESNASQGSFLTFEEVETCRQSIGGYREIDYTFRQNAHRIAEKNFTSLLADEYKNPRRPPTRSRSIGNGKSRGG